MSFRAICLSTILTVLVGSVTVRAFQTSSDDLATPISGLADAIGSQSGLGASPSGFSGLPDDLPSLDDVSSLVDSDGDGSPAKDVMPYVTEGSFFALIGFALGFASRKVVKLLLLLLAVFFAALQGLSYAEVLTVDWGRAVDLVNDFVLNLQENQTITEILQDRIPTAGGLTAGFALGYRKG